MTMADFLFGNLSSTPASTVFDDLVMAGASNHHATATSGHNSSNSSHHSTDNESGEESCAGGHDCANGLLLPAWLPLVRELDTLAVVYRAIIYLLALAYLLFGVNIITDRMVSAIEVIIAQKRTVRIKTKTGETHTAQVPIWHPVVATLTVFVIGASSAEIFLPVIEIAKHHFEADDLGPSLIFGSGAYHLFFITSICLGSVKETIGKPIQDLRVFFVTTAFSLFAYVWMFILISYSSPGEITLTEAIMTLAFFPILVFVAWFVERRLYIVLWHKLMRISGMVQPGDTSGLGEDIFDVTSGTMLEAERRRRLADLLRELKAAHPEKTEMELEEMAQMQMLESVPKGAAFYRMQASKAISGGGNVISKDKIKKRLEHEQKMKDDLEKGKYVNPNAQLVGFESTSHTCMESCVLTVLTVQRRGAGIANSCLLVDYETVDVTAKADEDYEPVKGMLEFAPGKTTADVVVKIIDDDEFEEDKDFKVVLKNPRLQKPLGEVETVIFTNQEATVRILDDDHCGVFQFETAEVAVPDNVGTAKIKVARSTGARGRVQLPFQVLEGSAKSGSDYIPPKESSVTFENDQFEGYIEVAITDSNRVGEIFTFSIQLDPPIILTQPPQNPLGNPVLGDQDKIKVGICEDNELAEALDRLLRLGDIADLISSTSWLDQFKEAVAFESIDEENAEGDVESQIDNKKCVKCHSCLVKTFKIYLIYVLSLPWRLIAACIPPSGYLHGWLAFILLLALMALVSALIGDLASAFGCTVGLKDTVTAITLIALGMGLPDTFASRHAAIHEKTADAAIGHITGSNAVNVFLGMGIAWTTAATYHTYNGTVFELPNTNMDFIVAIYCGLASLAVVTLLLRRLPPTRGELGGPRIVTILSASFFLALWIIFIILLTLESYCIINWF